MGGGRRSGSVYIGAAAVMTDPDLAELQEVFDTDDAEHILHAARSGCAYFLTTDTTTILNRVPANWPQMAAGRGGMLIVSAAQLIAELDNPT